MKLLEVPDRIRARTMTTLDRRTGFLLDELFHPGAIKTVYVDLDRTVVGSAVPVDTPLVLKSEPELRAESFLERRELGILNVGGTGMVEVDGTMYALDHFDCLYAGRGSKQVTFSSASPEQPAAFYLLSYPAHAEYPTAMVRFKDLDGLQLGGVETANKRMIYKAIHRAGIRSCQLVMGFTLLDPGSNWNTMPPHTHMRRSEVYLYFDMDAAHRVVHLMGPPEETSHLIVADRQVVVSPGWSVHAGVGTKNYAFCWGMGGENQDYDDMDRAAIADLK